MFVIEINQCITYTDIYYRKLHCFVLQNRHKKIMTAGMYFCYFKNDQLKLKIDYCDIKKDEYRDICIRYHNASYHYCEHTQLH